jgi:hypothetical protein
MVAHNSSRVGILDLAIEIKRAIKVAEDPVAYDPQAKAELETRLTLLVAEYDIAPEEKTTRKVEREQAGDSCGATTAITAMDVNDWLSRLCEMHTEYALQMNEMRRSEIIIVRCLRQVR